ncbi:SMI1/KNR4 family protein [Streptomyces sp. NPDC052042]|uniref:SMI1/KNR4 family protein n=1 Tax=Streptomyces sp. NPDC052042 TaxID=3365683 RepID=UPI0037D06333
MPFEPTLLDRLERAVRRYGAGTPTDRTELESALSSLGVGLDPDYAEFVERFGGCYVGVAVYGLRNSDLLERVSVVDLTLRFRRDGWPGTDRGLVVSFDLAGNPLVLTPGGPVTSYDHDAGRTYVIAPGFAALLDEHTED